MYGLHEILLYSTLTRGKLIQKFLRAGDGGKKIITNTRFFIFRGVTKKVKKKTTAPNSRRISFLL